ncbi:MAG: prepilin-type N-terminal cleavage/methylation domain-containing protein, partial [Myxococcota bacterium]
SHARGFTLLELMITVTILGILTVVAMVSYKVYFKRAKASEANSLLMEVRMKQEQYFSTYSRYIDAGTEADPFPATEVAGDRSKWAWTMNCPAAAAGSAMEGFCHLGMKPGATTFQLMTTGWAPGDAAPTSAFDYPGTLDTTQRWFYAIAFGNLDRFDQNGAVDSVRSAYIMISQNNTIVVDCETGADQECAVE